MPFPVLLLLIATALPLAASATLLPLGKRLGAPLAGYVAVFFAGLAFLFSGWAMMRWIAGGNYHGMPFGQGVAPYVAIWRWAPVGASGSGISDPDYGKALDAGIYVDSLTVGSFVTVTLLTMLIQIFATRSMRRDPRFGRFFLLLSLASFATLATVLSAGLGQSVLLLELVGLCASFLVGFRMDRPAAVGGAVRMFMVNRVGDVGLLLGMGLMLGYAHDLMLPRLWAMLAGAGHGSGALLADGRMPAWALTAAGVALFLGAAARCGQFPLQVWAGDPAEGVAPAAAMVYAVTLCFAAIYFLARLFPLFTPSARLFIALAGATTLMMAALIAAVQTDVKKVLAWGALSQLGFMVLALGVGSWAGAMVHLVSCTFVIVLLFLCAGAVIRGGRGETNLLRYGGLMRRMPVTASAAAVGVLALCGAGSAGVGLSVYYSRNLILTHVAGFSWLATAAGRSKAYWALFAFPVLAVCVNAFCMTRWWMLVFAGKPRERRLHEHAREVPTLYWPVVVLAVMTALAGRWFGIRDMLESAAAEARQSPAVLTISTRRGLAAATPMFETAWASEETVDDDVRRDNQPMVSEATASAQLNGARLVNRWVWFASIIGIVAAMALYSRGHRLAHQFTRLPPLRWAHAWLSADMYFDELYEALIVIPVLALARLVAQFDRFGVDGLLSLIGSKTQRLTKSVRLSRRRVGKAPNAGGVAWSGADVGRTRVRYMLLLLAAVIVTAVAVLLVSKA